MTGLVGFGFTVTTTGLETTLQVPRMAVSRTVEEDVIVMLAEVEPVLHLCEPVAFVERTTEPP